MWAGYGGVVWTVVIHLRILMGITSTTSGGWETLKSIPFANDYPCLGFCRISTYEDHQTSRYSRWVSTGVVSHRTQLICTIPPKIMPVFGCLSLLRPGDPYRGLVIHPGAGWSTVA